jgi:phage shock protein A
MNERSPTNVLKAYETLLAELEAEIVRTNQQGWQAFAAGKHAEAEAALERVRALTDLRQELEAPAQRLRQLVDPPEQAPAKAEPAPARTTRRSSQSSATPARAFAVPILRSLVELGGRAKSKVVLERVYERMRAELTEADLAPMASTPHDPHWRSAAHGGRNRMREDGLIVDGTPHGTWEISEKGRRYLEERE